MKDTTKRLLPFLLALLLVVSIVLPANAAPASQKIITTPTGYTKAEDVDYVTFNGIIANWGARGEDCLFLSNFAVEFYNSGISFGDLAQLNGSNKQNQVPDSALYAALQELMVSNHSHQTTYGETRYQYCYTDCLKNDTTQISSFYSGNLFDSTWDFGTTWNREHTWPASKSLSGRPSNSNSGEGADIIMLRPTLTAENGPRSNDAYGESSSYHDPGVSVRGDCARIMLYVYIRWGNYKYMWGKSGVMESVDILLKWMEEDPVDTWEMARNDSVQSITGTRNVFVDYPELAWLLFGQEIPADMTTPSGSKGADTPPANDNPPVDNNPPANDKPPVDNNPPANDNPPAATECPHTNTKLVNQKAATCTEAGYTGDKVCSQCSKQLETGTAIPAGHQDNNQDLTCDACSTNLCAHPESQLKNEKAATCQEEGYTGDKVCTACGHITEQGTALPKTEHRPTLTGQKDATCGADGYSGDTVCGDCNEPIIDGTVLPATGSHRYGQWVTEKEATTRQTGLQIRTCIDCGDKESLELPVLEVSYTWVIVTIAVAAAVCTAGVVFFIFKRKK